MKTHHACKVRSVALAAPLLLALTGCHFHFPPSVEQLRIQANAIANASGAAHIAAAPADPFQHHLITQELQNIWFGGCDEIELRVVRPGLHLTENYEWLFLDGYDWSPATPTADRIHVKAKDPNVETTSTEFLVRGKTSGIEFKYWLNHEVPDKVVIAQKKKYLQPSGDVEVVRGKWHYFGIKATRNKVRLKANLPVTWTVNGLQKSGFLDPNNSDVVLVIAPDEPSDSFTVSIEICGTPTSRMVASSKKTPIWNVVDPPTP